MSEPMEEIQERIREGSYHCTASGILFGIALGSAFTLYLFYHCGMLIASYATAGWCILALINHFITRKILRKIDKRLMELLEENVKND